MIHDVVRAANVQVFLTTLSKECIAAFNRMQDGQAQLLELYGDGERVFCRRWGKEVLEHALKTDGAFRGE